MELRLSEGSLFGFLGPRGSTGWESYLAVNMRYSSRQGENDPEGNSEIIGAASLVSKCGEGGTPPQSQQARQWSSGTLWVGSPGAVGW